MKQIEDAFLIFSVPLFSESHRKIASNPKKIYSIDTGLVTANLLGSPNLEPLFENLIYLDLRRRGGKVYYYKTENNYEIDFVVKHPSGAFEMLQVAIDISDPNVLAREERALKKASLELGIPGRIIDLETYIKYGLGDFK